MQSSRSKQTPVLNPAESPVPTDRGSCLSGKKIPESKSGDFSRGTHESGQEQATSPARRARAHRLRLRRAGDVERAAARLQRRGGRLPRGGYDVPLPAERAGLAVAGLRLRFWWLRLRRRPAEGSAWRRLTPGGRS